MTRDQDWLVPLAAGGGRRLFAFPQAGAGCAQLAGFGKHAAAHGVSVWAANLPGRQARLEEEPYTEFEPLVEELTAAVIDRLDDGPYALFGYCGGAMLAYGVCHALRERSLPPPAQLLIASYEAPDIARRPRMLSCLPSDQFWDYLVSTGGIPANLDGTTLRRVTEKAIRADFTWIASYWHRPLPPLPVPVTVLYGLRDTEVPRGALLGWRRHTELPVRLRGLDSGHWLIDDAPAELAAAVADAF